MMKNRGPLFQGALAYRERGTARFPPIKAGFPRHGGPLLFLVLEGISGPTTPEAESDGHTGSELHQPSGSLSFLEPTSVVRVVFSGFLGRYYGVLQVSVQVSGGCEGHRVGCRPLQRPWGRQGVG